jgi:hypothetical protein
MCQVKLCIIIFRPQASVHKDLKIVKYDHSQATAAQSLPRRGHPCGPDHLWTDARFSRLGTIPQSRVHRKLALSTLIVYTTITDVSVMVMKANLLLIHGSSSFFADSLVLTQRVANGHWNYNPPLCSSLFWEGTSLYCNVCGKVKVQAATLSWIQEGVCLSPPPTHSTSQQAAAVGAIHLIIVKKKSPAL